MNKQEIIEKFLSELPEVGESVYVRGYKTQNKESFFNSTEVVEVFKDGSISIKDYSKTIIVPKEDYKRKVLHIGANPFPEKPWDSRLKMISFNLESILFACGFNDKQRTYNFDTDTEYQVPKIEFNPFIIDSNGNEVVYQRDFCWTLEQKQLLIESIYNNIDIGKIVIRKRSYEWVENRILSGKKASFKDVVDGKQRLNALLEFVNNEFCDLHGNYWDDLSEYAQYKFMNFSSVAYGELGESASDEDVKSVFLNVNFSGVKMSQEHIDFVESINL